MKKSPFIESIRTVMRTKRYSLKTEKAYLHWIRRFIFFNGKRHPQEMAELEVEEPKTVFIVSGDNQKSLTKHAKSSHLVVDHYSIIN
jgi:hypothetical protein